MCFWLYFEVKGRPVLTFTSIYWGKRLFGPHGIFYCSSLNGHWGKKAAQLPYWQWGIQFLLHIPGWESHSEWCIIITGSRQEALKAAALTAETLLSDMCWSQLCAVVWQVWTTGNRSSRSSSLHAHLVTHCSAIMLDDQTEPLNCTRAHTYQQRWGRRRPVWRVYGSGRRPRRPAGSLLSERQPGQGLSARSRNPETLQGRERKRGWVALKFRAVTCHGCVCVWTVAIFTGTDTSLNPQ